MMRLLSPLREWFTVTLPDAVSSWLLDAFRRPLPFLMGLVVLPLAAIFVTTYVMSTRLWRHQALNNLTVTARLAAEIVDETLTETLRFERALAAQPGFAEAIRRRQTAELARQLEQALILTPRVDFAVVMSPDGTVLTSFPPAPLLAGRSLAQDEPFQGARDGEAWRPYVSGVYLRAEPPAEKVVGVVLPVEQNGTVVGLIQFQHRVEEVKSWLQKLRVEPDGFLYVTDHHGQLVVFPYQVLPGKPKVVTHWPPVAHPLGPDGAQLVFTGERDGRRWLAGVAPVGEVGWRVVAVQPEAAALRVLRRVLWPFGLMVGALAFLLIFLSLRWAQLQNSTMELLRQNTKLLKQQQQRRMLDSGKGDQGKAGGE